MRKLQGDERIEVTIGTDGEMVVRPIGIKGTGCKDVTKFIEALGEVRSDRPTAEMREESESASAIRHKAR